MISDDQIFSSFKNIRGTPQYLHNMLLDALATVWQFGVYTFFFTYSAVEFHWTKIIQVAARSEVVEFKDKYITCALPNETKYPEMSNLVKRVQTHHHTTTCRKKKGIACRFNLGTIR